MEDATEQTHSQHQCEQAYLLQLSTGTIKNAWKRLGYWWTIQISLIFFFFSVLKNTEGKKKAHSFVAIMCCIGNLSLFQHLHRNYMEICSDLCSSLFVSMSTDNVGEICQRWS